MRFPLLLFAHGVVLFKKGGKESALIQYGPDLDRQLS